jgi:hypothetical protein
MRNKSVSLIALVAALGFASPSAAQLGGLIGDGGVISTNDGGGLIDLDLDSSNGLDVDLDVGGENGLDTDINIGGGGSLVDADINAGGTGGLDVGAEIGSSTSGLAVDADVDLGGANGLDTDVSVGLGNGGLDTDVDVGLGGPGGLDAGVSLDLGSGGLDADVDIGLGGGSGGILNPGGGGGILNPGGGNGGGSSTGNTGNGGGNGSAGPGRPIIIVNNTNQDDQNVRVINRGGGSGLALNNSSCSRPDDRTGVALVNGTRYGSGTLSSWQNAAAVQVVSLSLCPQVRSAIASSLQSSGTANWLEAAIDRTPALRAGLNGTRYGADDVMAIDQQGGTLRIFVY